MRVLMVAPVFPRQAVDTAGATLWRLCEGLVERGHSVKVVAPGGPGEPTAATLGRVEVRRVVAAGGAPEIVRDGIDGALVATADADAFVEAVLRVERMSLDRAELRRGALRFDRPRFEERLRWIVADAAAQGRAARRASA